MDGKNGAEVKEVLPNSLAAEVGLAIGDMITKVDKTTISSTQQFADAMKTAKLSEGVKLTVRGGNGMERMIFVQKN